MIEVITTIYEKFESNKALFTDLGLEPIKLIDRYRGQPLNPEQFEYFDLPAIFYQWKRKWKKNGNLYDAEVYLEFHLVTSPTWETSNLSTNYAEGLKHILYENLVQKILDNTETENSSKLTRDEDNEVDTGVTNYKVLGYKCTYYDPMVQGKEYIEGIIETIKLQGLWQLPQQQE